MLFAEYFVDENFVRKITVSFFDNWNIYVEGDLSGLFLPGEGEGSLSQSHLVGTGSRKLRLPIFKLQLV